MLQYGQSMGYDIDDFIEVMQSADNTYMRSRTEQIQMAASFEQKFNGMSANG